MRSGFRQYCIHLLGPICVTGLTFFLFLEATASFSKAPTRGLLLWGAAISNILYWLLFFGGAYFCRGPLRSIGAGLKKDRVDAHRDLMSRQPWEPDNRK